MYSLHKCKVNYDIISHGRSHELCASTPITKCENIQEIDEAGMKKCLKPLVELLVAALYKAKSVHEEGEDDDKTD